MRVAWFGHKARKRGNGLVTWCVQFTGALWLVGVSRHIAALFPERRRGQLQE